MPRPGLWITTGAVLGLLAVAMGAFAAHGLEAMGDTRAVDLVETASRYQITHALAMGLTGGLAAIAGPGTAAARWSSRAAWLFLVGVGLFCGALYGIALGGLPLGPIAPIGGTAFLLGWAALAVAGLRLSARQEPAGHSSRGEAKS